MKFCMLVCLVVWVLCPVAAMADEGDKPQSTDTKQTWVAEEHWYGWQILISGGISLALPLALWPTDNSDAQIAGITIGGAGCTWGGPIIHWAHGAGENGLMSLGVNVLSIGLMTFVGLGLGSSDDMDTSVTMAVGGAYVGAISAILIDSLWLAYEPVFVEKLPSDESSFHIGLSVGLNGLSVVGQF